MAIDMDKLGAPEWTMADAYGDIDISCCEFGSGAILVRANGQALNEMQYADMDTGYPYICIDHAKFDDTIRWMCDMGFIEPTGNRNMTIEQFVLTDYFLSEFGY